MKQSAVLWFLWLGACGGGAVTPAVDARVAGDAAADVASDVAADAEPTCDVGSPPVAASMLPRITSRTVILGGDAGTSAPSPSGGDSLGRWLVTHATLYLPSGAAGLVIAERTSLSGTGWGVIEGDRYRIFTDLEAVIETVSAGTVRRPAVIGSRGTYTQSGGTLTLNAECAVDTGAGMGMRALGFSRDSMNRGRFFATLAGNIGAGAVIVLDLERVP